MSSALIGHTGFVGGNLLRQTTFDACFNSSSIDDIRGRHFDLVVCSGAPAEKWKANRDPEGDLRNIERLIDRLGAVAADHVVLISTVDVYPVPIDVDEDSEVDDGRGSPYGRHRRLLERFIGERFSSTVVRLPGLYGHGLKKNIIFDLLHDNMLEHISADSVFQFYGLDSLWADVGVARAHDLRLVNFATEPVTVRDVAHAAFGRTLNNSAATPARYDMRSRHGALFGGSGGYLQSRNEVLRGITAFVASTRLAPR